MVELVRDHFTAVLIIMSYIPVISMHQPSGEGKLQISGSSTNRFIEMATIGFLLPDSSHIVLQIFDLEGSVVLQRTGYFDAGEHHFLLNRSDFPESGMYLYRIESAHGSAFRRIMLY
jgi:hypothetical protein